MAPQAKGVHLRGKQVKDIGGKKRKRKGDRDDGLFTEPPAGTYDPSIRHEAEAVERGLEDTLFDTKRERKRLKKDLKTSLRDLAIELRRGRQDIGRDLTRGRQDVATERAGIMLRASRGEQDFFRNLDNLVRSYGRRANAQGQALNAAGLGGGGAYAASAAKRAENFRLDRQPLDVQRERLGQDVERALTGLETDATRMEQDAARARKRLGQDVRHDRRLTKRDARRGRQDIHTERQRAKREAAIAIPDLTESMVFDARQRHPGAFSKYGDKRRKKDRF